PRLLQAGTFLEPEARSGARVLRRPRLRDPWLQLQGDAVILRVSRLAKRYGARVALEEVSFELHAGEVLAVVGESGSGKTTLLNSVSGSLNPDAAQSSSRRGTRE